MCRDTHTHAQVHACTHMPFIFLLSMLVQICDREFMPRFINDDAPSAVWYH